MPALVDLGREGIGRGCARLDRDRAADQMMVEHEPRVEQAAQHNLAHAQHMIELGRFRGLERQAGNPQDAHQAAVAQAKRHVVDMGGVGQPVPGTRLAAAPGGGSPPFRHSDEAP